MAESQESNECSPSTYVAYKRVIVRGHPARRANRPAQQGRFSGLTRRNHRDRLTITLRYKGGAEGWWIIEARGRVGAFPSGMALVDVMAEINRTPSFFEPRS